MKIIKTESTSKSVEVFKKGISKIGTSLKSNMKRNVIILGALVLLCGAVLLNINLFVNANEDKYDPSFFENGDTDKNDANANAESKGDSYFAMAQLDRAQARDEALEVLYSITTSETATEEEKSSAFNGIENMAKIIEQEANIETLIKAKGFTECVAVINDDNISVIVNSESLMPSQIAQITEIVYEVAEIIPSNITIIEKQ